jgi:pimeloyl-ACP methyl ester carboxylesterase
MESATQAHPPSVESSLEGEQSPSPPLRLPCPAPAKLEIETARYESAATVERWDGPVYPMRVRRLGQGPPVLVLPGIFGSHRVHSLFLNRLAERFETIFVEYPGEQRDTRARLGRITHERLADQMRALVDHLHLGPTHIVGLSFGSTLALRMLASGGARAFPSAAIQGAAAFRPLAPAERLAYRVGGLFDFEIGRIPYFRRVMDWNHRYHFPLALTNRWEYFVREAAHASVNSIAHRARLVARLDLRPVLSQIDSALLILRGSEDRAVPAAHFEMLQSALPHARGVVMPVVGHQPHLTHAELLASTVGQFFAPIEHAATPDCPGDATCDAAAGGPCTREAGECASA